MQNLEVISSSKKDWFENEYAEALRNIEKLGTVANVAFSTAFGEKGAIFTAFIQCDVKETDQIAALRDSRIINKDF
jgi:hypothetical protein